MLLPAEGLGSLTLFWNGEVLGSPGSSQGYWVSCSLLMQSAQKFPSIRIKCQNLLSQRMHSQAANLSLHEFSEPQWITYSFLPSAGSGGEFLSAYLSPGSFSWEMGGGCEPPQAEEDW